MKSVDCSSDQTSAKTQGSGFRKCSTYTEKKMCNVLGMRQGFNPPQGEISTECNQANLKEDEIENEIEKKTRTRKRTRGPYRKFAPLPSSFRCDLTCELCRLQTSDEFSSMPPHIGFI